MASTEWINPVDLFAACEELGVFGVPLHITEFVLPSAGQAITGWKLGRWYSDVQA